MGETPQPGSIVHIELPCNDTARAKKFYGDIFGWTFEDVPEMNYSMFQAANGPGGGLFIPEQFNPGGALNYILVEDLEAKAREVESAGGQILVPPSEIPNQGWFAIFKDPEGTTMALWKSAEQSE